MIKKSPFPYLLKRNTQSFRLQTMELGFQNLSLKQSLLLFLEETMSV
jgi:hypothetical protein